ncbi:hypothetical protein L208DRAFT_1380664 [Tricholoma matsutake]|nr:hypothetical protein L208DRAFT_1380664 [Tricholoma matsutake 945]
MSVSRAIQSKKNRTKKGKDVLGKEAEASTQIVRRDCQQKREPHDGEDGIATRTGLCDLKYGLTRGLEDGGVVVVAAAGKVGETAGETAAVGKVGRARGERVDAVIGWTVWDWTVWESTDYRVGGTEGRTAKSTDTELFWSLSNAFGSRWVDVGNEDVVVERTLVNLSRCGTQPPEFLMGREVREE